MLEVPESHDLPYLSDGLRGAFAGQFFSSGDCVVQDLRMGVDVGDALADRIRGCDDVSGQLLFQVAVTYFALVPLLIKVLNGFRCGYDLHDGEEVLYVVWLRRVRFGWSLVGQRFFHLLLDGLRIVC